MPKLFVTDIASEAQLKVHVTDIRSEAHAVIFETTDHWDAADPLVWCYTDIASEADRIAYFTDSAFDADLVVFKTDVRSDVQWNDGSKSGLLA